MLVDFHFFLQMINLQTYTDDNFFILSNQRHFALYHHLCKHRLKARLHGGKNHTKLVGFKEQKKIFCIFKTR
jgi:hypothetical protein